MPNTFQDEFTTRVIKRESWTKHGETDMETESVSGTPGLAVHLGTNYYVDLRRPKTENEFKRLTYQLEALSDHFDELTLPLRKLKPATWTLDSKWPKKTSDPEGDMQKKVWSRRQVAVFAELKDTLFDIIEGKHPWTRNSTIQAYHPSVPPMCGRASSPHRLSWDHNSSHLWDFRSRTHHEPERIHCGPPLS